VALILSDLSIVKALPWRGGMAQWSSRTPQEQKIVGSNPPGVRSCELKHSNVFAHYLISIAVVLISGQ
jgi:hypothetical protein